MPKNVLCMGREGGASVLAIEALKARRPSLNFKISKI